MRIRLDGRRLNHFELGMVGNLHNHLGWEMGPIAVPTLVTARRSRSLQPGRCADLCGGPSRCGGSGIPEG
jgi:hypothetical protein